MLTIRGVGVLLLDHETARVYADLWCLLRRNETPIPTNDVWVAAQAMQHDLTLSSDDEHFRRVPGMKFAS